MKYKIEFKISNTTNLPLMRLDCDDLDVDLEELVNQYGTVTISLLNDEDKKSSKYYVKDAEGNISVSS